MATALSVEGLGKSFGANRALDGVSFEVAPGEVHGLVGENGAGKSTLIQVVAGALVPDAGRVLVQGREARFAGPADAEAAGISVVYQEPAVFPDLDAVDNLMLGQEPTVLGGLLVSRRASREAARSRLAAVGADVPLGVPLGHLSLAQRQQVAIARALAAECRLLVLDEPTASLPPSEAGRLHEAVRRAASSGVAVLFVSHRLDEVLSLCSRVTVLKDGRLVATEEAARLDPSALARLMVGRDLAGARREARTPGAVALAVEEVVRAPRVAGVSFQVREGEVVGLGGLVGAGRTEVARIVAGCDRPDSGRVAVHGQPLRTGSVRASVAAGVAMVPEDRQREGLIVGNPMRANLCEAAWGRRRLASLAPLAEDYAEADEWAGRLGVRPWHPEAPAAALSGGNQQKVVFGKWMALGPRVVVLDEPTRGVDVGAKEEIYALVDGLAQSGTAVLLVSSDLPELLRLSDRVLVLREGRLAGELTAADRTEEAFMLLAAGAAP